MPRREILTLRPSECQLLEADFDPSVLPKGCLVLLNVRNIPFLDVSR